MNVSSFSSRYCSMLLVNEEMLDLTALYPAVRDSGKSSSATSSIITSAQWHIVYKANTTSKSQKSCRFIINSIIGTNKSSTREYELYRTKTSIFYNGFILFFDFLHGIGMPTPSNGVMDSGTTLVFCMASSAVTDTSAFAPSSD